MSVSGSALQHKKVEVLVEQPKSFLKACSSMKFRRKSESGDKVPPHRSYRINGHFFASTRMSVADSCCSLPPVQSTYSAVGEKFHLEDVNADVYTIGPKDSTRAIIQITDIFGLHPNALQVADIVATKGGFRVVVPDFFRGKPWPIDNMPPKEGREALVAWIHKEGAWSVIEVILEATRKYLVNQGAKSIGVVGFCWGAKMAIHASRLGLYDATALVHPSFLAVPDDAKDVKCPVLLLPSKEEADLIPLFQELQKLEFGKQCGHQRFDDMYHGFCAARGKWDDELVAKRANEAIQLFYDFFQQNLKQ